MLLLYLKENYFHLIIAIILLYNSFCTLSIYLKEHHFHLIIIIIIYYIILLYSLLYDYQFCTYLSDLLTKHTEI